MPRALREGGYRTWHIGKWHLGGEGHLPTDHGFDINIGGSQQGSQGRGGYFSRTALAGVFYLSLAYAPSIASNIIGFRAAKAL